MYQNQLNNFNNFNNFNNLNVPYAEQQRQNYTPIGSNRTGLMRSASTSCAIINNNYDQPRAPPRRKRGQSLSSDKLGSANSSQYSLVLNYAYNEIGNCYYYLHPFVLLIDNH